MSLIEGEQLSEGIGQSAIDDCGKIESDCICSSVSRGAVVDCGQCGNNNKNNNYYRVRPVSALTSSVYDIPFHTIVEAWIDCERSKKRSNSCTRFRLHAQRELVQLWNEMRSGKYKPRASMCFIVTYPVKREVWAASFRDRVAHHWEYSRFNPIVDGFIVESGDCSMNCRKGYGSLRAVRAFEDMMREYSAGYKKDCWIVGGDFANFFMSIDRPLLWRYLSRIITKRYDSEDKDALLYMLHETVMNNCRENFVRRSPIDMWRGLPRRKSLFYMDGLPIGNLTSQIMANFLGSIFCYWMTKERGIKEFMIFVDDWRAMVATPEDGKRLLKEARAWLAERLHITLHPDKIYLQHYTKGCRFVGAIVKPYRTYISNRSRGRFITKMMRYNAECVTPGQKIAALDKVRDTINSYLGMMIHFDSYNVRRRIATEYILPVWGRYLYFTEGFSQCYIKRRYDRRHNLKHQLRSHDFTAKFIRPKWTE